MLAQSKIFNRSVIAAVTSVAMISCAVGSVSLIVPVPAFAQTKGPQSVAELAAPLLDAVVNISTTQRSKEESEGPKSPVFPEDSPFKDLFDDYFNKDRGTSGGKVNSLGSGFVIDPSGYVVTNNHVIEGADEIEVIFTDGKKLKATLVGTDSKTDLSVLKVTPEARLVSVKFGDSRSMLIGDWVMAIGNPFGLGGSLSVGIISARGRNINAGPYDNFIQTDAAINKGNSGGPLFNLSGEVIGINTAIISPSGGSIGIGFAVPTELAENIIDQLIEFGETRRGWLGVRTQPVTDDMFDILNVKDTKGAYVSSIVKGGPVENGPVLVGDIILSFDGKKIDEMRDFTRIVAESPINKELDLTVLRDGKERQLKVTLAQLQDALPEETATEDSETHQHFDDDGNPITNHEGEDEDLVDGDDMDDRERARKVHGMNLVTLTNELRESLNIGADVEGVLIDAVDEGSVAELRGIKTGDVIVEIGQDFMEVPGDVLVRINGLKAEGRKNAHLMLSDKDGKLRIVALPLE